MVLTQLQYFRVIAREQNMTIAAQKLHISQSALSQTISKLEETLGVPLFERRKGKISITPIGEVFCEYVDRSLSELDNGINMAKKLYAQGKRQISVSSAIHSFLNEFLIAFYVENPEISIRQFHYQNNEIAEQLLKNEVDFAIITAPINHPRIEWEAMLESDIFVLVSDNHRLANRNNISIKELAGERFLCNFAGGLNREITEKICADAGFSPNFILEDNEGGLIVDFLDADLGISFVPSYAIVKMKRESPLSPTKAIRLNEQAYTASIGIAKRKGRIFSNDAVKFYDFVKKSFVELKDELKHDIYTNYTNISP
ncbi:MAG: Transcriptional regulator, LysR family [Firmicutes bacterium]|nr:Transcriptional regulator, LysR family [Bacillota bacterium]